METRLQGLELAKIQGKVLFYGPDGSALHDSFEGDSHTDLGLSACQIVDSVVTGIKTPIIPKMTSNNSGGFIAKASSTYSWSGGGAAYQAYDDNPSTGWLNSSSTNPVLPAWNQITTPDNIEIGSYMIQPRHAYSSTYDGFPTVFQILGSNNEQDWDVIDEQSGLSWTHGEQKFFIASGSHLHRRVHILETTTGNATINTFQLYSHTPMTVISKAILSASVPSSINCVYQATGSVSVSLSRDDGDTWASTTPTYLYDNHDGYAVYSVSADVTGQPSDNKLRYKIEGTGQLDGLAMWAE